MAENGVIEILRGIQADMSGLKADMAGLKHDMSGIKADIAGLKSDVIGVKAELHSHSDMLNVLTQDVRMIRGTIHDMGETRPTEGELVSLHEDVNRALQGLTELKTRIGILESQRPD
jgi:chromosome segregation ATPase